ncbi:ABC transporter ATP-binding protein [Rhizobium tumorigenes]|uniref:ABC transporter ATP-binding protein n=1 Tax=Rhizobium tumorigenes TaxID=2041385 RepID=A0AAF1KAS2_9HYPH|nr:ABC transporter ATP-binding protein [Rhizobium tumorigenes]WFR98780.1 ABC transporter ATP-binding protein [Rhizobium tumorigenes]
MSTITIDRISKRYGGKIALDDISLQVESGEMIALLGSSGCGKTTLLRCIAGLAQPDEGRILFGGEDVTQLPTQARPIGMVFQAYALFPNMTVRDNIAFPLKVRGMAQAKIAARVDELLALVGLDERADHHPNMLSGGQQQRTALARALAPDPAVLLLDEPLSALDAVVRDYLRDEIRRIQQSIRTTAILVTHDQSEALAVADRVVVMRSGRAEQVATPADLYNAPATDFSAGFIGNRNRFDLAVRNGAVQMGKALLLPVGAIGDRAQVFVRSEDVLMVEPGQGHPARVDARMFQGQTTRFYLQLDLEEGPVRLRVDWPSRSCADVQVGSQVHVAIDPADAHVFAA